MGVAIVNKLFTNTGAIVATIIIVLFVMMAVTTIISAQDKADYEDCPAGYFWRGSCVQVTGCPNGDSIPIDSPDCGNEPTLVPVVENKATEVPEYTALPDFEGK